MRTTRQTLSVLSLALASCVGPAPASESAQPLTEAGPVPHGSHPYSAFLRFYLPGGASHRCTGTLVTPTRILTAAHCAACAASVEVSFYGDSPTSYPDGAAPTFPSHILPGSAVHWHPKAYSTLYCDVWNDGQIQNELDDVERPHDVAVLDLPAPVSHPHVSALTMPPHGFSPVQDLAGQAVTLVGRGETVFGQGDASIMREGTNTIARYGFAPEWNFLGGTPSCHALDPNDPFILQVFRDPDAPQTTVLPGDSGGPIIAQIGYQPRVIGVASALIFDPETEEPLASIHASTFASGNASWLAAHGVGPGIALDADGDHVPDSRDNCPLDYNPDQLDYDEDSVGDLCDVCSPMLTSSQGVYDNLELETFDGTPASAFAHLYDPLQDNVNAEAEAAAAGRAPDLHFTGDGYVTHLESLLGIPCTTNGVLEDWADYRRGDACDPIPAPVAHVKRGKVPDGEIVNPLPPICNVSNYGITFCRYVRPTGAHFEGVLADGSGPRAGEAGVRFCACDMPHATPAERALYCDAGTAADCAIDGSRYALGDPSWRPLHINGGTTSSDAPVGLSYGENQPAPFINWDFPADVAALSATPVSQPFTLDGDGNIIGATQLDGILWAYAPTLEGDPIAAEPLDGLREPKHLASTYDDGDLRYDVAVSFDPFPQYKPAWPWEYCAVCGILELPFLHLVRDWLVAVGPEQDGLEVSSIVGDSAWDLFQTESIAVVAAESTAQLGTATMRELRLNPSSFAPIGALHLEGGQIAGELLEGAELEGTPQAFAFSATEGALFAMTEQRGITTLHSLDTRSGAWSVLGTNREIGTLLSMTYRVTDGALYALAQNEASGVQLLQILPDGEWQVLADDLGMRNVTMAAISNDERGGLLLAASQQNVTKLAHVTFAGGELRATDLAAFEGSLGGPDARETPSGRVHVMVGSGRAGFTTQVVEPQAFEGEARGLEETFQ